VPRHGDAAAHYFCRLPAIRFFPKRGLSFTTLSAYENIPIAILTGPGKIQIHADVAGCLRGNLGKTDIFIYSKAIKLNWKLSFEE